MHDDVCRDEHRKKDETKDAEVVTRETLGCEETGALEDKTLTEPPMQSLLLHLRSDLA